MLPRPVGEFYSAPLVHFPTALDERIRARNPYAYRRFLTVANVPMLLVYANTAG